jgi:TP901 family phage tail tape measure protein
MAFNLVASVQAQLSQTAVNNLRGQLGNALGGVKISVPVEISDRGRAGLAAINGQLRDLQGNAAAVNPALQRAVATAEALGAAMSGTATATNAAGSALGRVNVTLRATSQATDEAAVSTARLSQVFRGLAGIGLGTAAVVAFARSLRESVGEAVLFNREVNRLGQLAGDGKAQVRGVAEEVGRLSTGLGVSSRDLIKAAVSLRQAGVSIDDVKTSLEAVARTNLAPTFGSAQRTAEGLATVLRQFGLAGRDAASVLGSVNAVSGKFAVDAGDLLEAVGKAGGAFAQAGGRLQEFLALFASVRATTKDSAESIASSLTRVFTRLQQPGTVEALRAVGVELRHTKEEAEALGDVRLRDQFVGPLESVRRLGAALQDIRGTDPRFGQLVDELGGQRQVAKVVAALREGATAQKALNEAMFGGQSLTQSTALAQTTLANKTTQVREEFLKLGRDIADSKGFQAFAGFALDAAKAVTKLVDAAVPLLPVVATLVSLKTGLLLRDVAAGVGRTVTDTVSGTLGKVSKFAGGGVVPGVGNTDSVPAYLTPGEFVVRKAAAQRIGYDRLAGLNAYGDGGEVAFGTYHRGAALRQHFADGGPVGFRDVAARTVVNRFVRAGETENGRAFAPFYDLYRAALPLDGTDRTLFSEIYASQSFGTQDRLVLSKAVEIFRRHKDTGSGRAEDFADLLRPLGANLPNRLALLQKVFAGQSVTTPKLGTYLRALQDPAFFPIDRNVVATALGKPSADKDELRLSSPERTTLERLVVRASDRTEFTPQQLQAAIFAARSRFKPDVERTLSVLGGLRFADGGEVPGLLALNRDPSLRDRDDVRLLRLKAAFQSAARRYVNGRVAYLESDGPPPLPTGPRQTVEGILFERYVSRYVQGFNAGRGLDFPSLGEEARQNLARLTGLSLQELEGLSGLELKRTATAATARATLKKANVPAFASGGVVQHFAAGGRVKPVRPFKFSEVEPFLREEAGFKGGPLETAFHQLTTQIQAAAIRGGVLRDVLTDRVRVLINTGVAPPVLAGIEGDSRDHAAALGLDQKRRANVVRVAEADEPTTPEELRPRTKADELRRLFAGFDRRVRLGERAERRFSDRTPESRDVGEVAELRRRFAAGDDLTDEEYVRVQTRALGKPRNVINDILAREAREAALAAATTPAPRDTGAFLRPRPNVLKANVPAFADGGEVPALLMPGEYVLSREAVQRLGVGAVRHMNQFGELPRFHQGGLVQHFADGGGPIVEGTITELKRALSPEQYRAALQQIRESLVGQARQFAKDVGEAQLLAFHRFAAETREGVRYAVRLPSLPDQSPQFLGRAVPAPTPAPSPVGQDEAAVTGGRLARAGALLREFGPAALFTAASFTPVIAERAFGQLAPGRSEAELERAKTGEVIGGTAQGFATGAALGAAGGLPGIVIGGVIGGLIGLTSSLKDAERKIADLKFEKLSDEVGKNLKALTAAPELDAARLRRASQDVDRLFSEARQQGLRKTRDTEGFFSGPASFDQFQADQKDSLARVLGPQLPELGNVAGKRVEALAKDAEKATPGQATAAQVFSRFAAENGRLLDALRTAGLTAAELARQFKDQAQAVLRSTRAHESAERSASALASRLANLQGLTGAFDVAAASTGGLQTQGRLLASLFEGRAAGIETNTLNPATLRFGLPGNDRFGDDLAKVTGALGQQGVYLRQEAESANRLLTLLPDVLRGAAGQGALTGDVFTTKVLDQLTRAGGIRPGQLDEVRRQLDTHFARPDASVRVLADSGRAAEDLTRNITQPLQDTLQTAAKGVRDQANQLVANLAAAADAQRKLVEERVKGEDLRVAVGRNDALRLAQAAGQPARAADLLPVDFVDRPFRVRQEALSGLRGPAALDPDALARRLQEVLAQTGPALAQREAAQPGEPFAKAAAELQRLQTEAVSLRDALKNLTDAGQRNAEIQARLGRLESEREGRLSLGERLLAGGPQEQLRLSQGAALTVAATRQGSLNGLDTESIRAVFDFLNATSNVKLAGLGGITGRDLKGQLLERSLPGIATLSGQDQGVEAALKGAFDQNLARAAAAQEAFLAAQREILGRQELVTLGAVDQQRQAQREFFGDLRGLHANFLGGLHQALVGVEINRRRVELGGLEVKQGEARQVADQARLLQDAGVDDPALAQLRQPQGLDAVRAFAEQQLRLDKLKATLDGGKALDALRGNRDFSLDTGDVSSGFLGLGGKTPRPEATGRLLAPLRHEFGESVTQDDAEEIIRRFAGRFFGRIDPGRSEVLAQARREGVDDREVDRRLADFHKGELLSITRDVLGGRLATDQDALGQQRQRVVETTGLQGGNLERFLSSVVQESRQGTDNLTKAVQAVESLTVAAKNLETITAEIASRKQDITTLERPPVLGRADGGAVPGVFRPRGTDVVPAMLSPGEYVVNRDSARANLSLLEEINGSRGPVGFAAGGPVRYLAGGGRVGQEQAAARALLPLQDRLPAQVVLDLQRLARSGQLTPGQLTQVGAAVAFKTPLPPEVDAVLKRNGVNLGVPPVSALVQARNQVQAAPGVLAVTDKGFEDSLKLLPDDQLDNAYNQGRLAALLLLQQQGAATRGLDRAADVRLKSPGTVAARDALVDVKEQALAAYDAEVQRLGTARADGRDDKIAFLGKLPPQVKALVATLARQRGRDFASLEGMSLEQLQALYLQRVVPDVVNQARRADAVIKRLEDRTTKPGGDNLQAARQLEELHSFRDFLGEFPTDPRVVAQLSGEPGRTALLGLLKKAYNGRQLPADVNQFLPALTADRAKTAEQRQGVEAAREARQDFLERKAVDAEDAAQKAKEAADAYEQNLVEKGFAGLDPDPKEKKELNRLKGRAKAARIAADNAYRASIPQATAAENRQQAQADVQSKARQVEIEAQAQVVAQLTRARDDAFAATADADSKVVDAKAAIDRLQQDAVFAGLSENDPAVREPLDKARAELQRLAAEFDAKSQAGQDAAARLQDAQGVLDRLKGVKGETDQKLDAIRDRKFGRGLAVQERIEERVQARRGPVGPPVPADLEVANPYQGVVASGDPYADYLKNQQALGFADGGAVPGTGSSDSVPAMLTPGEYVLTKAATQRLGVPTLNRVNHFAQGGLVGSPQYLAGGGAVSPAAFGASPEAVSAFTQLSQSMAAFVGQAGTFAGSVEALQAAVGGFGTKIDTLAAALQHMNELRLSLEARHLVEVVFNGQEVFQNLEPGFRQLAIETTNKAIQDAFSRVLPDAGYTSTG